MARVTVEDCLENVDNRFQLVLVATKRARQILLGGQPMVDAEKEKPTVTALREISEGYVTREILFEVPEEEQLLADLVEASEASEEEGAETEGEQVAEVTTEEAGNATEENA